MMKTISQEIGRIIREDRESRGISLRELSMRSGVAKGNLSKIERGCQKMTVETLEKLAHALALRASTIVEEAEE